MILKLKIPSEIIIESETYNLKSQKLDETPCKISGKVSGNLKSQKLDEAPCKRLVKASGKVTLGNLIF